MRIFALMLLASLSINAFGQKRGELNWPAMQVDPKTNLITYTEVPEVGGVSAADIYDRAMKWGGEYFKNFSEKLKKQDKTAGEMEIFYRFPIYAYDKKGVKTTTKQGLAQFSYDAKRRTLTPLEENAAWMIGEEVPTRRVEAGLIYSPQSHPSQNEEVGESPAPIRIDSAPIRSVSSILDELPDNDPTDEEFEAEIARETPRLVSIRENASPGDKEDGIAARAKVPSWDEIMFGRAATTPAPASEEFDLDNDPEDDLFK